MAIEIVRELVSGEWVTTYDDGSGSGGGDVLVATFSLAAAELKASTLTPAEVIPAPGAGKMIVPVGFSFAYKFNSVAYTSGDIRLVIGTADLGTLFMNAINAGADLVGWTQGVTEAWAPADVVNGAVKLSAKLRGAIAVSHIEAGGSGYADGDTGTVDFGTPLASYVVDDAGGGGDVVAYTITSGGGDYTTGSGNTTTPGGAQPGGGSGFAIVIDSIDASGAVGDGTLTGAIAYYVLDVP